MPLTPLHLGPGFFLGILTLKFLNLWAILLASVIADIEPIILIIILKCYRCPHHWFFHSILGAILGSLVLAFILGRFRKKLNEISLKFGIKQSFSFKILFSSSLIAWLIHLIFDSLTHYDVFPFWPFDYNPIYIGPRIYWQLSFILLILGVFSLFLFYKVLDKKNKKEDRFN